jgi:hypothetical protein
VIVPRATSTLLAKDRRLAAALQQAGWQVGRRGAVIYAVRGGGDVPAARLPAARAALRRMFRTDTPKQPVLVVAAAANQLLPQLPQPVTALATARRSAGSVVITTTIQPSLDGPHSAVSLLPAAEGDTVRVNLPGSTLADMPAAAQEIWQEVLREKLGFTEAEVTILPPLRYIQAVQISFTNNHAVVGTRGNPELVVEHLTALLEEQDARRRPYPPLALSAGREGSTRHYQAGSDQRAADKQHRLAGSGQRYL